MKPASAAGPSTRGQPCRRVIRLVTLLHEALHVHCLCIGRPTGGLVEGHTQLVVEKPHSAHVLVTCRARLPVARRASPSKQLNRLYEGQLRSLNLVAISASSPTRSQVAQTYPATSKARERCDARLRRPAMPVVTCQLLGWNHIHLSVRDLAPGRAAHAIDLLDVRYARTDSCSFLGHYMRFTTALAAYIHSWCVLCLCVAC